MRGRASSLGTSRKDKTDGQRRRAADGKSSYALGCSLSALLDPANPFPLKIVKRLLVGLTDRGLGMVKLMPGVQALTNKQATLSHKSLAGVQENFTAFYNHPFDGQVLPNIFGLADFIVHDPTWR